MTDLTKRLRAPSVADAPDRYTHKGIQYIRGDLAQINDNRYTSSWWLYGAKYALVTNPGVCAGWYCLSEGCERRFIVISREAASQAQRHMESLHIPKKAKTDDGNSLARSSQQSSEGSGSLSTYKSLFYSVDTKAFEYAVLRLYIIQHLSFLTTSSTEWKEVLRLAHPTLPKLSLSRTTLRRRAKEEWLKERERIKALLKTAISKIHLSFDMWSSPNRYAVFGVVAHFVRSITVEEKVLYRNQAVLLGLKRMRAKHDAAAMSKVIVKLCETFEIHQRLGCFQSDNPEFNDNTVRDVLTVLEPTYEHWEERRGRCIGHVINLAAKALIFGTDVDAFVERTRGMTKTAFERTKGGLQRAQDLWRSQGAVGKLHNLVRAIRTGPQRSEYFKAIRIGDKDVDSKYSSGYVV